MQLIRIPLFLHTFFLKLEVKYTCCHLLASDTRCEASSSMHTCLIARTKLNVDIALTRRAKAAS
jgi:hypothetical protein